MHPARVDNDDDDDGHRRPPPAAAAAAAVANSEAPTPGLRAAAAVVAGCSDIVYACSAVYLTARIYSSRSLLAVVRVIETEFHIKRSQVSPLCVMLLIVQWLVLSILIDGIQTAIRKDSLRSVILLSAATALSWQHGTSPTVVSQLALYAFISHLVAQITAALRLDHITPIARWSFMLPCLLLMANCCWPSVARLYLKQ